MNLIIDSGSTKTHVMVIGNDNTNIEYFMPGINPFFQNEDDILRSIKSSLSCLKADDVQSVFHYGAGCSFPEKKSIVRNAWERMFPNAQVEVATDMLGAARALLGKDSGIACILGTGANSCYCENGEIVQNVPPLGFVLGDEGSGAYLGGKLVANCMKGIYNEDFVSRFYKEYNCDSQEIMDAVYKKEYPSRYLASFVPFISKNIDKPEMEELVRNAFVAFFERNVMLYGKENVPLGFIGGVAYQFFPILKNVAKQFGFYTINVISDPIEGLVSYHNVQNF